MATCETLSERTRTYGENCYIEVARRRLTHAGKPKEFLVVTRGFCDGPDDKRASRYVNVPDDPDLRRWLAEALLEA